MRPTVTGHRGRQAERGVALIIVLLVLSLLLTVVGEFALAMRLEATTTINFRAAVASGFLAQAGFQRAAAEILPDAIAHHLDEAGLLVFRHSRLGSPQAPPRQDIKLGTGQFSYRITDEEARINLNRATPDQLHRLLTELGIERETRDVIVDSIQDWRDPNEEHRLNGAESDYYLALPVPYKSKNADFDSVEELLLVRGITPQIFYGTPEQPGLGAYVTVAGSGAINLNTASDVVLRTLGYAQAELDNLKQGRPYLDASALPSRLRGRGSQQTVKSTTFRIEASGEVPRQGRRTLRAVAQRQLGPDGTLRASLRSWQWVGDEAERP
jgi:type II secretory pathway component PulK